MPFNLESVDLSPFNPETRERIKNARDPEAAYWSELTRLPRKPLSKIELRELNRAEHWETQEHFAEQTRARFVSRAEQREYDRARNRQLHEARITLRDATASANRARTALETALTRWEACEAERQQAAAKLARLQAGWPALPQKRP